MGLFFKIVFSRSWCRTSAAGCQLVCWSASAVPLLLMDISCPALRWSDRREKIVQVLIQFCAVPFDTQKVRSGRNHAVPLPWRCYLTQQANGGEMRRSGVVIATHQQGRHREPG